MAEPETELEYKQRFILRITEFRTASGMKQWQIAEAMGIPQDKYKQYDPELDAPSSDWPVLRYLPG